MNSRGVRPEFVQESADAGQSKLLRRRRDFFRLLPDFLALGGLCATRCHGAGFRAKMAACLD
jgi:hypothetical protein